MKYRQLTREQLHELHESFARFLAAQKIDINEWEQIKRDSPEVAEEEINIFSDLVWEKVLSEARYLDHYSAQSINLFQLGTKRMSRLVVKIEDKRIDLTTESGLEWLKKNAHTEQLSFFKAQKFYTKERNSEIFDLIEKGGNLSDGKLYQSLFELTK